MTLSEYAIQKRVTTIMVTLGFVLVGTISFIRLPQELYPPVKFPQVTIVTDYANAAPEEIERLITRPIEEAVGSVAGLKRVESVSREGRSTILVSFNWGQDIDFAALAVREKIDLVKERLPKEAEDPVVLKFDPLARPIMIISVTGSDLEPVQLKLLTEKLLKDNLEKVEGVASANISGGVDREIVVEVDQSRLQANHLSLLEIIEGIEEANVSYPAGSIKKGLYEYLIRTVGEFRSVREIEYAVAGVDTVSDLKRVDTSFVERGSEGPRQTIESLRSDVLKKLMDKRLVLVRDIADVKDTVGEINSLSRYNGQSNISISVQKQANANTIQLVDRLRTALDFLREDMESRGIRFQIIYDHSIFIRESLENLLHEALMGGLLAFIVLFLFLRSPGASLLVTLSIPVTIMVVFFLMSLNKITLNIMSLGGLALAVGMIVDTSIVVLENIFRRRQLGESPDEGAARGTNEVMWAVVASNLTTIAVFFPLIVFVPGIVGQIIKDLAWTVIFSLTIAILVPLTLVAMLSTHIQISGKEYSPLDWTKQFRMKLAPEVPVKDQNRYLGGMLAAVLGVVFVLVFMITPALEREVLPKVDQGQFIIRIEMPIGTRLGVTDRVSSRVEEVLGKTQEVKDVAVTIGSEKGGEGEIKIENLRPSQALILVTLKADRDHSSDEVIARLRKQMESVDLEAGHADFVLQESDFQFAVKPVLIEVKGYEFDKMEALADEIRHEIAKIPGVFNILDDRGESSPETQLQVDKRRAALYGISALDVSLIAKAAIDGVVASQYREAGREYDIRVQLSAKDRDQIENLNNLLLYSHVLDALIPLKEVAEIEKGEGPSEIRRANQDRTITISADISKKFKSKDVLARVQQTLAGMSVPPEFQVLLSGKLREIQESFSPVIFAFILSILLVYMIMASLFESFMQPLIIMITVPLAFAGVALALWLTGTTLNVISLLGVIVLGGVVVNNGIVLIEYINQLRESGQGLVEAALEASRVRTRPILMSALTTIAGLIPLSLGLGEGSELRQPLAITVMGGLLSSTVLTLVVVPFLYILVTRVTDQLFNLEDSESDIPGS